ncbi:hypothetical protein HK098_002560 [Nowakowskiella sp. JEL0407]|nr:hypothetical protein HK098_002560 [Nowakowskiella sp. JEL0407]
MTPSIAQGGASLLISWSIKNKNVLVVGGCEHAASRVFYALESDAHVTVVSPLSKLCDTLHARLHRDEFKLVDRHFSQTDLDGKSLVVCVSRDEHTARSVLTSAKQRKIPVNVSIFPELSDFWFCSTHRESGIQIAVSTGGNGPKLADKIRRKLAGSIEGSSGRAVKRLSTLRQHLVAADKKGDAKKRLEFINRVTDQWSIEKLAELTDSDIKKLVDCYLNGEHHIPSFSIRTGTVKLVGAGPGSVELLTVAAHSAIVDADLLIVDSNVPKDITEIASGHIHFINVTEEKHAVLKHVETLALEALKHGKDVVRLVSGDPFITGYGVEEYKILHAHGFQPVVIPGLVSKPQKLPYKPTKPVITPPVKVPEIAPALETEVPPVKHVKHTELSEIASHYRTVHQVAHGANSTVAAVSYALSDVAFSFPVFQQHTAGDHLHKISSNHTLNAYGHKTKIVSMATRVGTGSAVHGTLSAGNGAIKTSVVASSPALSVLIPSMYEISRQKLGTVFHVSTSQKIDDSVELIPGIGDVVSAAESGFAVVTSSNVQESYDMALASHIISGINSVPVLHAYDGAYVAREIGEIHVADEKSIKAISGYLSKNHGVQHKSVIDSIECVFDEMSAAFGKHYQPFEYFGSKSADVVIVSIGVVSELVKQLVKDHSKIGVVSVRVYRPWSAKHFMETVPKSAGKVIVLDDGTRGLFGDVLSVVYSGWKHAPRILKAEFKPAPDNFSVAGVAHAMSSFIPALASVKDKDGGVVFWDYEKTRDVAKNVFESSTGLKKYVSVDSTGIQKVVVSQLSKSTAVVKSADYIGVHAKELLSDFNIAKSVMRKGTIVVNAPWKTIEDVEKEVPGQIRAELARKNVNLVLVDADYYAKNFTLYLGKEREYVVEILSGVYFHLKGDAKGMAELKKRCAKEDNFNVAYTKLSAVHRAIEKLKHLSVPVYWTTASELHTISHPAHVLNSVEIESVHFGEEKEKEEFTAALKKKYHSYLPLLFKEAFKVKKALRPDVKDGYEVTLTENIRVTPDNYDRNVFHMEMDISGTGLKYDIGEALGVYGHNDAVAVERFLHEYGADKGQVVEIEHEGKLEIRTLSQVFIQHLDVFGKPGKKFYAAIAELATDPSERAHLFHLISTQGSDDLKLLADEHTVTYADLLIKFKSARPSVQKLLWLIPTIKPRHYSIASSQNMHPDSVHLLVVLVDWNTPVGEYRTGQCTRYLSTLKVGQTLTVSVKPSVMKLPPNHSQPVIMAGLGTGMAPFRAFIEERAYQRSLGVDVGPMVLYFGSRHRAMEYLYGEELEAYAEDGLLTHLRLAFSRDQKQKIYIQHKIKEDKVMLSEMLLKHKGAFYLCGPTWPVPDVRAALVESFEEMKGWSKEHASEVLEELKEEDRYILEVY